MKEDFEVLDLDDTVRNGQPESSRAARYQAAKSTVKKGRQTGGKNLHRMLRVPLIATGTLLVVLLALYFVGSVLLYRKAAAESQEAVNRIEGEGTLPGNSGALDEEEAQAELIRRLLEEYETGKIEGEKTVLEQIRQSLVEGTTVVETLRPFYKDQLVVASDGKYHFLPVKDSMKKNGYLEDNLNILESGELQYLTDGKVTSYKGIDVSVYQGTIDWNKVAEDGVTFTFIRAGYRGWGSKGTLVTDENAEANLRGANGAGIKTGVYFYTQATNEKEILEEVQLVLDLIKPYRIDCPVVIDVEKTSEKAGRMNQLDVQERTKLVKLFCDTVQAAGYRTMIYHNLEMGALMLDLDQLEEYDKWFAFYKSELYYPYAYKIWQYSDKGSVQGIKGAVDMNIAFEPVWVE